MNRLRQIERKGVRLHASRFPGRITSRGHTRQNIVANDYDRPKVLFSFAHVIDHARWFSRPIASWANGWGQSKRNIGYFWPKDVAGRLPLRAAHKADVFGFCGLHGRVFRSRSGSCAASPGSRRCSASKVWVGSCDLTLRRHLTLKT